MVPDIQDIYRTQGNTRAEFGANAEAAKHYYADYVRFVVQASNPAIETGAKNLLDLGCGVGRSSECLAEAGYEVTGVDLNAEAFEPALKEGLRLVEGSALALPFADESFDVVATFQCLEHIPDPESALREMVRVCRPGGTICIVGPNLLSPFLPIKSLIQEASNGTLVFKRVETTPTHPNGNTVAELLMSALLTPGRLLRKLLERKPTFWMRQPDSVPPFYGDNDACYLCNPTDLLQFFRAMGWIEVQSGKPGRPPMSSLFAGGTWIAAQKPALEEVK